MTRLVRKGDQQLPEPGKQDVGPEVVRDVLRFGAVHSDSVVQATADDFRARIQLGIERYGQPLQTHNGRDALVDALQEALDLAHYLKQLHMETGEGLYQLLYWSTLGITLDLKQRQMLRDHASPARA